VKSSVFVLFGIHFFLEQCYKIREYKDLKADLSSCRHS